MTTHIIVNTIVLTTIIVVSGISKHRTTFDIRSNRMWRQQRVRVRLWSHILVDA